MFDQIRVQLHKLSGSFCSVGKSYLVLSGSPHTYARTTQRILVGVWLITVVVLANSFASLLKSQHAVGNFVPEVDSIMDVAARPHLRPLLISGTYYENYDRVGSVFVIWISQGTNSDKSFEGVNTLSSKMRTIACPPLCDTYQDRVLGTSLIVCIFECICMFFLHSCDDLIGVTAISILINKKINEAASAFVVKST